MPNRKTRTSFWYFPFYERPAMLPLGRRMRKDSSPKVVRPFDAGSRYQKTEELRRSKAEHLGTTFYGWDGDRLAWESTEESCVHYLYEPGSFAPIAQARSDKPIQLHRTPDWSGKAYKFSEDPLWQQSPQPHPFSQIVFYHCDQIGTPQEMTDEEGEIAWQAQYKAWGEAKVVVEKIRNPLRFQGQYFDHETGLHYNRFRYYDPEIGRYLSKDPIGIAGGLNLHAYVANPIQWVDPLGLVIQLDSAATPVEIADYNTAITYLKGSSEMTKIINDLESSKTVYTVKFHGYTVAGRNYGSAFLPGQNTIYWEASQAVRCSASNQTISPALVLGHEMAHANQGWFARLLSKILPDSWFGNYDNYEEWRVITGPEAKTAKDLGEGLRTSHHGSTYPVTSPILR
jgi:RHS repeat-associated protein